MSSSVITFVMDAQGRFSSAFFSKSTLPDTDIEIYEYKGEDIAFTGKSTQTADFTISKSESVVDRYFPGIDLGIAGLFEYHFDMYQHTVSLTDLKPDTKYVFRVGNEYHIIRLK